MKKKAKQERSRNTIKAVLEAASQVLITEGYHAASTNHIAERAGFSIGTLYQYFDNKEDIFHELLAQTSAAILESVVNCPPQPSLRELLEAYNIILAHTFNDDPELIQALGGLISGPFQAQREALRESVIDAFAILLRPHEQEIPCKNILVAARVVVLASEGLGSAANSVHFLPEGFHPHLLRLQLAYLTSDIQ